MIQPSESRHLVIQPQAPDVFQCIEEEEEEEEFIRIQWIL